MPPDPKLRVFLDTNVIFSGLYSPNGAHGTILENFVKGNITVIVSRQVLEEVIRVIKDKIPMVLPVLNTLLENSPPEVFADPELKAIQNVMGQLFLGDAAILGAAMAAKPDYFITGDNHFLRNPGLVEATGLSIVTPAQFLQLTGLK